MKRIYFFLGVFILLFFSGRQISAQDAFTTKTHVIFEVNIEGTTYVTHEVSVTNTTTETYLKDFSMNLVGVDPVAPHALSQGRPMDVKVEQDGDSALISTSFTDFVVGKGKTRDFTLSYEDPHFVEHTGEVWEITLPKLDTSKYDDFTSELKVPKSFGVSAYVSPDPVRTEETDSHYIYYFDDSLGEGGVAAAFGQFQAFSFDLTYHLENPVGREAEIEIAIPPDTAFQKVIYEKLEPLPEYTRVDKDGNWIAVYKLASRERVDVKARGTVQIMAAPNLAHRFGLGKPEEYLFGTKYWQVNDPKIQEVASNLHTPKEIYDYVVENLNYDYDRVKPNTQREGALFALNNPSNVICMEFTDLFVTLSRAAGIPAREVNGYAYTDNPVLQPLGLVADVLHSWPEYWDSNRGIWIPVDPTWGDTTGGVDFFNKLDLRHFAFVIHGLEDDKPYPPGSYKLGANPQKDVYVSVSQLPESKDSSVDISVLEKKKLGFGEMTYTFRIYNFGPSALYGPELIVFFDDEQQYKKKLGVLPPFSYYDENIDVPVGFFAKNTPSKVSVEMMSASMSVSTNRHNITLIGLTIIFGVLTAVASFISYNIVGKYIRKRKK